MKFNTILKGLICPLLLTAIAVKAETEFVKECLEVKELTNYCEVNSQGKIDSIELYLDTITEKEVDKLLSYKTITKLNLHGHLEEKVFTQRIIDKIGTLTNLKEFEIYQYKKGDKKITFEPFKKLTKVEVLSLWGDDGVFEKDILDKFSSIKELQLWDTKLNQKDINTIGSYKNLKLLSLYNVEFEKNSDYSSFKNIRELEIGGDDFIAEKNFIKSFKNLNKLLIEGRHKFKQSFIDDVANLPMEEIHFNFYNENDLDINVLKKLKNLSILDLNFFSEDINLKGFKTLKSLDLGWKTLSQTLINDIGGNSKLETLYISYDTDAINLDYSPLKKIKSLTLLNIAGVTGKDDELQKIAKNTLKGFNSLEKLYMSNIILYQRDINDIVSLPNLKEIVFYSCDLINGNIDILKNKKNLTIKGLNDFELNIYNFTSNNGKCGEEDGKCPEGQCCSKYGYCGTSDKHCTTGCQSEFGECKVASTTTTKSKTTTKTTTTKITTTTKTSLPTSTNGKCGKSDGQCPSGQCCSKYGWCGKTDEYCGKGCQSEFGQCKNTTTTKKTTTTTTTTTITSIPTTTKGRCGAVYGHCSEGECCSMYGWCGKSDSHCGYGCQSEFGKCN